MSTSMVDIVEIQKMVFIFNAVLAGWRVRMIDRDKFEFSKDRRNQEVDLEDYLRQFVTHNLNIESIGNSPLAPQQETSPNVRRT